MVHTTATSQPYQPPQLRELGSVHALTQGNKNYGPTDGYTFQGDPIANAS